MKDAWNPDQYQKFAEERNKPFQDLLELIEVKKEMTILDLGCGTGSLTQHLHKTLHAKKTIGIDSSTAMLKECGNLRDPHLQFFEAKIEDFIPTEKVDLIFSNAALQWVPDHKELITKLTSYLKEDGQVAIQMPDNFQYPTHKIALELGREDPFNKWIGEKGQPCVLKLEEYAEFFYKLGFQSQIAKTQIYPHLLESTESILEWVKGSLLTYYQSRLPDDLFEQFLKSYGDRIFDHFGEERPFFLPFKRMLLWAKL